MDLKYIHTTVGGLNGLILFPAYMSHLEAAGGRKTFSAGFVDLATKTCYGESVSLGVKADPSDTARLRAMLGEPALDGALPSCMRAQAS